MTCTTNAEVRASQEIRDSVRVVCRNVGIPVRAVATDRLPHGWKLYVFTDPQYLLLAEETLVAELSDYIVISTSSEVDDDQGVLTLVVVG